MWCIETLYVKEKKKKICQMNTVRVTSKKLIIDKYKSKNIATDRSCRGIKTQAEITINNMTKMSNITTVNQAKF